MSADCYSKTGHRERRKRGALSPSTTLSTSRHTKSKWRKRYPGLGTAPDIRRLCRRNSTGAWTLWLSACMRRLQRSAPLPPRVDGKELWTNPSRNCKTNVYSKTVTTCSRRWINFGSTATTQCTSLSERSSSAAQGPDPCRGCFQGQRPVVRLRPMVRARSRASLLWSDAY